MLFQYQDRDCIIVYEYSYADNFYNVLQISLC